MTLTNEKVREELKQVIDPEIGINIVDLGLVYEVKITESAIDVVMTLTSQGCPMGDYITGEVSSVLGRIDGAPPGNVILVWEPPWDISMANQESLQESRS